MQNSKFQDLPVSIIRSNRWLAAGVTAEHVHQVKELITRHGSVRPLVVRPAADGGYLIVSGEGELEAVRELKANTTEAVVVPLESTAEAHKLSLQLLSLHEVSHHLEQALIMKEILKDPGVSQTDLARLCGRSISWVSKRMRLVESLQPVVVDLVAQRALAPASAQEIAKLPAAGQQRFAERVVVQQLPKAAVEKLVSLFNAPHTSEELRQQILAHPQDVLERIKTRTNKLERLPKLPSDDHRLSDALNLLQRLFAQIKNLIATKPQPEPIDRIQQLTLEFLAHLATLADFPQGKSERQTP